MYLNDILPLLQIGGTVVLDLYHMKQVLGPVDPRQTSTDTQMHQQY